MTPKQYLVAHLAQRVLSDVGTFFSVVELSLQLAVLAEVGGGNLFLKLPLCPDFLVSSEIWARTASSTCRLNTLSFA